MKAEVQIACSAHRHRTLRTAARCAASQVWWGWRRSVVGDGRHALVVESSGHVSVMLFETTRDRDTARLLVPCALDEHVSYAVVLGGVR